MSVFQGGRGTDCPEHPSGYHADQIGDGTCTWCGTNIIFETADERLDRDLWQDPAAAELLDETDRYYDS